MNEEILQSAMQIILHAGDARLACKQALDAISINDFKLAKEKLKESQIKITEAHRIQTDVIQKEMSGEKNEYSLLLTHAQDTLMTIYSEINIAKQLLIIFTNLDQRISKLEN